MFQVVKSSPKPLADQLVEEMSRLIESGRLAEGSRLPSVRQLARRAGVSSYTVTTSFERLYARGLIESRAGSGHYVARRPRPAPPPAVELGPPPHVNPALSFAGALLCQPGAVVPAGAGFLPPQWLEEAIPSAVFSRIRGSSAVTLPAPAQGDQQLRELLVERLRVQGVPATAANVLITVGASQAFDLLARTLLSPGDTVLVDDPGYFVLHSQLKAHHLNVVPVAKCAEGSDLERLEEAARLHRPRIFFTQTLLHNPTGITASAANCHGILKLAERYDFLLAEDHIYTDLGGGPLTSLAQIDELRRVVYIGSFSKVLCPGVRLGYLAATETLLSRLIEAKILAVLSTSRLDEFVVREALASGKYRRHVERLRERLAKARPLAVSALRATGVGIDNSSCEGYFLWGRLPQPVDWRRLDSAARAAGILLAPGPMFSLTGGAAQYLRINTAYAADPTWLRFLAEQCERGLEGAGA